MTKPSSLPLADAADEGERPAAALIRSSNPDATVLGMIERLSVRPDFDVQKMRELVALQERILDRNAEAEFNAAFAEMQAEIPEIDEKGRIMVDGQLRSQYAKFEDIQKVIKPILKQYGFSLAFETQYPDLKTIKVIGILTHRQGHSRRSEFLAAADKSGGKNDVQAQGSSTQYGRRYTTCDLLNISTRGVDDDGQSSERPPAPDGYEAWLAVLDGLTASGLSKWQNAWNDSKPEFKNYTIQHRKEDWSEMKSKAQRATRPTR